MAISIKQYPATASLAQTPIAFSVSESAGLYSQLGFIYQANLYYWTGSIAQSGSYKYQLQKYPNASNFGIFDMSKIIASAFGNSAYVSQSDIRYFKAEFNYQYQSGSSYITASSNVSSGVYYALDGYLLTQNDTIGEQLNNNTVFFPFLTSGPNSQSVQITDHGTIGLWSLTMGSSTAPTTIGYTASYAGGLVSYHNYSVPALSAGNPTYQLVAQIPFAPQTIDSAISGGFAASTLESYTIQAYAGGTAVGSSIRLGIFDECKYTPVRIQWKNRFGQFDYFDFPKVNRQSFKTKSKDYRPQIGSWNAETLTTSTNETTIQKYIIDTDETILVNTDWLTEDYNDIFKELMVSPEIYWQYNYPAVKPLSITTSDIQFKTVVNDQLIQYSFTFNVGQSYKLIL